VPNSRTTPNGQSTTMTILCTERIADTNELQVRLVEFVGNLPLVYLKSP
jgi:hypothetical protein